MTMMILFEFFVVIFFSQVLFSNADPELKLKASKWEEERNKLCSFFRKTISHSSTIKQEGANPWSRQDLKTTLRTYYANHSELDFKVADFELLFRKGILTENQAILIWENLLNTKTERNLEWLEYNKYLNPSPNPSTTANGSENRYFQSISMLFDAKEFKYHSVFAYFGGAIIYTMTKCLFAYPKVNIVLLTVFMVMNVLNSFYFYNSKFFFTSCVCLCSFLSNIYFLYLNVALLCGEKEADCSIFYVKHYKKKKHFFLKVGICSFILVTLVYLTSFSLRFHLNYVMAFFLLEKIREMIRNYFKFSSHRGMQPINSFISFIFGLAIFTYTNVFYYSNISFSYQLNSFLFVNNFITFYYFGSLNKYVFIQKNDLGDAYIEAERVNERRDKYDIFDELQKTKNSERAYRSELLLDVDVIDVLMLILALTFLIGGFLFTTYFYIVLSFFFLHAIMKNSLICFNMRTARIVSSLLLLVYLLIISNLSPISFSYVNEIIALYDRKLLDVLLQLVKLGFFILLGICIYISEDYSDLFRIHHYSSYQYLARELSLQCNPRISKICYQTYTLRFILCELLAASIEYTCERVKSLLEVINEGSIINKQYFEMIITRASSNMFTIAMVIDYSLSYFTLFVLKDIFSQTANSFFYIAYVAHRICLYLKMGVTVLEYSKTHFQQYACKMLTCVLMLRFFNSPENDQIDMFFSASFGSLTYMVYMLLMDNSNVLNAFFVAMFWMFFNVNIKGVLGLPVVYGMICAKVLCHCLQTNRSTLFVFISSIFLWCFLFSLLNFEIIKSINYQLQIGLTKLFGFDVINILARFCFVTNRKEDYFEVAIIDWIKEGLNCLKNYVGR